MPDLEPITREEMLWSGEDIEPITREEMYIKHIFDKTQTIPSKPLTRKEMLLEKAGEGGGSDVTIKQLSVTENGTYSEENTAYSPVIVNVPAPPIPDNAYLLNDLSGLPADIARFTDGSNLPMPSFKVGIEPVQDLHEYDHPWVGGSGKNKLKNVTSLGTRTINGVTITTREDGSLLLNGTSTGGVNFIINNNVQLPDNTYILSTDATIPTNSIIAVNTSDGNKTTRDSVTFTGSVNGNVWIYVGQEGVVFNNLVIKPMIRLASVTDATFEPYSNICPISGHTEANVIVSPTTDAEDGTTYNVQFTDGSNPLTVYGGSLDVTSGELTVDRVEVIYDGSSDENWVVQGNAGFYIGVSDKKAGMNNYIANNYMATDQSGWDARTPVNSFSGHPTLSRLYFRYPYEDFSADDLTAWRAWLASNNVQVVYELATPLTIQLTPTQVNSLLGVNNVWADCGDIIDGQYFGKEV